MTRVFLTRGFCVALAATLLTQPAVAQRFEGIITMKLSAGNMSANVRSSGNGSARGGAARGVAGRGAAGRGGDARGRGGDSTVAAARAAGRAGETRVVEGRGADGGINAAQAEALRSAFSGGLQQIEYMSRRGKIRIALVGAGGKPSPAAMIYAPDDGVMYTLLPPVSMYSETAIADLEATVPSDAPAGASTVPPRVPTVTHTKQFELIAGHKCEHVLVTLGKQKTDICMGKGLGVFIMPVGLGRADGWDRVLTELNGFPLKVMQADGTVTMEVVKIERKALPESLFAVPDSYSKMPDLMRRPPG